MVDISSQNNKINITVSSSGNTANTNVTPDYAQYYSEKSKEWAISNRMVDNIDYSSKYYANESKKQADISTAKTAEVVESGNNAVSNIENARDNAITNVNTAGATQVALATEQATIATNKTSEVVESGNTALANIDTAKNNAITSITNQETTSKNVLIDEGATQIGLIQNEGATQVANVQSTGFYMQNGKLYYIDPNGETKEFKSGSGLEVCDIGMALYVDETKGLRRYLNGQIVDINTNTQAFLDRLKEITTLHPSLLCTESEWQTTATMTVGGQVGKFVVDNDAGTIRLPKIIMPIQGLTDLSKLGEIVEAGLPNITGNTGNIVGYLNQNGSGAMSGRTNTASANLSSGSLVTSANIPFDASKSNPIYGNSNTVQQEAIQYPYFIQIATGQETENNIINEIELNNPYSLFDSKYSDHELNNLSWLKSEGQWNAKAVYPTAYDKLLKVYNGTETVEGLSVKLSTETYTDYDFVLNTIDETFRLPLLDGSEDLPSDRYDDLELLASGSTYNAPANGWFYLSSGSVTNTQLTKIGLYGSTVIGANGFPNQNTLQVKKGAVVTATYGTTASTGIRFIYAKGNGSLYFYVGETVQNANLIDAGRIGEQLANKADISTPSIQAPYLKDTYVNGTSWYRIWSDGYCEQGGRLYNANDVANTITLLKTMKDTNYSVFIAHGVKGCYSGTAHLRWAEEPFNFTATSFQIYTHPSEGLNTVQWKVCGYLASGQY